MACRIEALPEEGLSSSLSCSVRVDSLTKDATFAATGTVFAANLDQASHPNREKALAPLHPAVEESKVPAIREISTIKPVPRLVRAALHRWRGDRNTFSA